MGITYYASGSVMNNLFGSISFTPPANYYVGLSTSTIGASGSDATEPTSGSYYRVAVSNDKTKFSYLVSGSLVNKTDIAFPESNASWGIITDVGFWDASSGGNMWFYQALPNSRTIDAYTQLTFSASAIVISMTN